MRSDGEPPIIPSGPPYAAHGNHESRRFSAEDIERVAEYLYEGDDERVWADATEPERADALDHARGVLAVLPLAHPEPEEQQVEAAARVVCPYSWDYATKNSREHARTLARRALVAAFLVTPEQVEDDARGYCSPCTDTGFSVTSEEYLAQIEAAVERGDAPAYMADMLRNALDICPECHESLKEYGPDWCQTHMADGFIDPGVEGAP